MGVTKSVHLSSRGAIIALAPIRHLLHSLRLVRLIVATCSLLVLQSLVGIAFLAVHSCQAGIKLQHGCV